MKKIIAFLLILTAAGLATFTAQADTTNIQVVPFHVQSYSGSGCPGSFNGYAYMTNSAGTMWLTPPAGTVSGTFTDLSGFTSATCVTRSGIPIRWCATNPFPVSASITYELYTYVQSSGLTNGQPITLQVVWH